MKAKRLLSILLAVVMVMGIMPAFGVMVMAADSLTDSTTNVTLTANDQGYYQIGTANELIAFANLVNSGNTAINGILTADVTLNENLESKLTITTTGYAFNYGKATLKSGQTVNEWAAIGTEENAYTGTFDGDGHSVIGLYVNKTDSASKNNGLFGYVNGGTIKNVTVEDSYICAYSQMGGIVGLLYSGTVENCHCNDTWLKSSNGYMGGIVGYTPQGGSNISISDCSSNVVYYQYGNSGGIAGSLRKANIDNCVFTGELKGTSDYSGGIVGSLMGGSITNCTNNGIVKGGDRTGGIAGTSTGNITNCTNNGVITTASDSAYIGGIVGDFYGNSSTDLREITNCTNNGTVTQTGNNSYLSVNVGGIAGQVKYATITNCINNADISGAGQEVGGIIGTQGSSNSLIIEKCANYGNITAGGSYAGGIAGKLTYTSLVKDSYNVGDISSNKYPGGIAGFMQGSSSTTDTVEITGCYSAASVTGTKGGGIVGQMNYKTSIRDNYYDSTKFTGSAYGYVINSSSASPVSTANVGKSTAKFASGEICYLMNNSTSEGDLIWYQTLGEDDTPVFTGEIVYYDETNDVYYNDVELTVTIDGETVTVTDRFVVLGIDNGDNTYSLPENVVGYYIDDTFVDAGKYAVEGGEVITTIDFNVTMIDGAQVRYGGGLDENGKVYSGNGLRFLATVDRSEFDAIGYGMRITAEGSSAQTIVDAEKWQDDTTFSVALTDMAESNYIRKFTATPFVKVSYDDGTEKTIYGTGTVTRSIYQVAAGLLKDETQTAYGLSDVLNAYANQTGIRLVVKGGELMANTNYTESGSYKLTEDELHFEVSDAEYDKAGNKYSVILTAIGNAEIITDNDYWYDYIRINNNNSLIKDKVTVEKVEGSDKAVKVTFAADGLIERPSDASDNKIPDNAGDNFDSESGGI